MTRWSCYPNFTGYLVCDSVGNLEGNEQHNF